ncbi:MAG: hypothetical protein OXN25_21670 [Candidatus Poribacteria bacterium]|nr:hypothetical protein [Candidatus Poribacteria bacterium]
MTCTSGAAGLNISQYNTFRKGGEDGAVFDVGNGKGSLVVKCIDGGGMPPIPPPLNADHIQFLLPGSMKVLKIIDGIHIS